MLSHFHGHHEIWHELLLEADHLVEGEVAVGVAVQQKEPVVIPVHYDVTKVVNATCRSKHRVLLQVTVIV